MNVSLDQGGRRASCEHLREEGGMASELKCGLQELGGKEPTRKTYKEHDV